MIQLLMDEQHNYYVLKNKELLLFLVHYIIHDPKALLLDKATTIIRIIHHQKR